MLPEQLDLQQKSSFEVNFSTSEAYRFPISDWLTDQLKFLDGKQKEVIKLCLHEAISNAIKHGNLDVGRFNNDTASFLQTQEMTMMRLEDPVYGGRKVCIRCECTPELLAVEIEDEGKGYDFKAALEQNLRSPYPRGLTMIQRFTNKMRVLKKGKCIRMEFLLHDKLL